MLQFLSPIFLAISVAGASLPIIIHLLNRRQTHRFIFGTIRFIQKSIYSNEKRHRLKELLLLLLRALILCCLGVAFARPFWSYHQALETVDRQRNVVVVLDCSYSMGVSVNGSNTFMMTKRLVSEALDQLTTQDKSALVHVSNYAKLDKFLDENHQLTQAAVDSAQLTHRGTNLLSGLQMASELLQKAVKGQNEIWLASDLQKVGWSQLLATIGKSDQLSSGRESINIPSIRLLTVPNQPAPPNLAVTGLVVPQTIGSTKATILARIRNFGQVKQQTTVSLFFDEKQTQSKQITVEPQQIMDIKFQIEASADLDQSALTTTALRTAQHKGFVEITDQSVQIDNRRYFSTQHIRQIRLHLIHQVYPRLFPRKLVLDSDQKRGSGEANETFYLQKALQAGQQILPVNWTASTQLPNSQSLETAYDLMIVHGTSLISVDLAKLLTFVQQGGGLLIAGSDTDASDKFPADSDRGASLLTALYPCQFYPRANPRLARSGVMSASRSIDASAGTENSGSDQRPASSSQPKVGVVGEMILTQIDFNHPLFRSFQQQYQGDFSQIQFDWVAPCLPDAEAEVVASFEDGTPLLIEKSVGRGRVIFLNARLDRQGTDFPIFPIYLPFLHSVIRYLALYPTDQSNAYAVGDVVDLTPIFPKGATTTVNRTIAVFDPSGKEHRIRTQLMGEPIHFSGTELPGIYQIYRSPLGDLGKPDQPMTQTSRYQHWAINLDTIESDLESYDSDEVMSLINASVEREENKANPQMLSGPKAPSTMHKKAGGQTMAAESAPQDSLSRRQAEVERQQQIWWFIVLGVLLLSVAEMWLANRY